MLFRPLQAEILPVDTPKSREPAHPAERATPGTALPLQGDDDDSAQRRYLAMRYDTCAVELAW